MLFRILDNPGTNLPYIKVNQSHYWDSDSKSKNYNTLVNNETYSDFNVSESEHIIDINPGYEYCLNIDYNEEQTPYKGAGNFGIVLLVEIILLVAFLLIKMNYIQYIEK